MILAWVLNRFAWVCLVPTLVMGAGVVIEGCGYLSNERYTLMGCAPQLGVCRVFDTYTGTVHIVPLPQVPAEKAEQEVGS